MKRVWQRALRMFNDLVWAVCGFIARARFNDRELGRCLIVGAVLFTAANGMAATLLWDPNPPGEGVDGYKVYHGTNSRDYTAIVDVGTNTSWRLPEFTNAPVGAVFYFAVTAYTADQLESPFSEEVYWQVPPSAPGRLRIVANEVQMSTDLVTWTPVATIDASKAMAFYRIPGPSAPAKSRFLASQPSKGRRLNR